MRKISTTGLLALWAILVAVLSPIFRETYWALFVESLLDSITHGLGIEKPAMMAFLAPIILVASVTGIVICGAYRIGRWERTQRIRSSTETTTGNPQSKGLIADSIYKLSRDVSLNDSIWRAFMGQWGKRLEERMEQAENPEADRFEKVCDDFRQYAFEGKLPIWAARPHSELYEPLPKDFWRNRRIVWGYMLSPETRDIFIAYTHPLEIGQVPHGRSREWDQFMTNKKTVEKLWPAPKKSERRAK
jgi:hypothetical protein